MGFFFVVFFKGGKIFFFFFSFFFSGHREWVRWVGGVVFDAQLIMQVYRMRAQAVTEIWS